MNYRYIAIFLSSLFLGNCASGPAVNKLQLTFVGSYHRSLDPEDQIRCVCADGGYILSCAGQHIDLCFEEDAPEADCPTIEIWGYFKNQNIAPGMNGHCQGGTMRYFLVERWECKE